MDLVFASAGCVTCLFYVIVVLFSGTRPINKYLLLSFIILLSTSLLPVILNDFDIFPPFWMNASFGLLWGPLLYFYIISLLKAKINFKFLPLHFLPFAVYFMLTAFFDYDILPKPPNVDVQGPMERNSNTELIYTLLQSLSLLGYSIVTLYILNKHNKQIQDHYSYKDVYLTIRWSYIIILFFVSAYLLVVISTLFKAKIADNIPFDLHIILISTFIYVLGYLGLKQNPVYLSMENDTDAAMNEGSDESSKGKYSKNKLNDTLKDDYQSRLLEHLANEKPYLQPKLCIDDLSTTLDIPKHFLSQIINDSLNHTFYSLINSYRVKEVKERIMEDQHDRFTLLAIAMDSGFNSKSGFNKNFKLETGMTPLEFKNSLKT